MDALAVGVWECVVYLQCNKTNFIAWLNLCKKTEVLVAHKFYTSVSALRGIEMICAH